MSRAANAPSDALNIRAPAASAAAMSAPAVTCMHTRKESTTIDWILGVNVGGGHVVTATIDCHPFC